MRRTKTLVGGITVIFLLLISLSQVTSLNDVPQARITRNVFQSLSIEYLKHNSIYIDGNENLNATAKAENWPGDGTRGNPYIIDGFNITSTPDNNLIEIRNTNMHFRIQNCFLGGGKHGIYLDNVRNGQISNISIVDSYQFGIRLNSSGNSIITGNNVSNIKDYGIYLKDSGSTILSNNYLYNNMYGIYLKESGSNTLSDNVLPRGIYGMYFEASGNNSIFGNSFSDNYAGVFNSHSDNSIFSNNIFSYNMFGIYFTHSRDNSISDNIFSINRDGIHLHSSESNIISSNNIYESILNGIYLDGSYSNTISSNNIYDNQQNGISFGSYAISGSPHNTISSNIISNNGNNGIYLYGSPRNTISGNIVSNNSQYGLFLDTGSIETIVKWNDFVDNNPNGTSQGKDTAHLRGIKNTVTYNHWNDWISLDANADGFVDLPYFLDGYSNRDEFPLMSSAQHVSKPVVLSPNGGETFSTMISIQWTQANDSWGHNVTYSLFFSSDEGSTWIPLARHLTNTSYNWNTTLVVDGIEYVVKVVVNCSEGLLAEDTSDEFFTIQKSKPTPGLTFTILFPAIIIVIILRRRRFS